MSPQQQHPENYWKRRLHNDKIVYMSDVTLILATIQAGNRAASSELLPLVYDELRKLAAARMAAERPDHTLQATALVHEAYLRLVDNNRSDCWDSRAHFFAAAAEAMRRILIEAARRKQATKHGGQLRRVDLGNPAAKSAEVQLDALLDLDAQLQILELEDPEAAQLVKLRVYAGLSTAEAARVLEMPRSVAYATWEFVRTWFAAADSHSSNRSKTHCR